jgi:hypothetical protein
MEVAELCIKADNNAAQADRLVDENVEAVLSHVVRAGGWPVFEEVIGPSLAARLNRWAETRACTALMGGDHRAGHGESDRAFLG